MNRHEIVETVGADYLTANIEEDEWSYAKDAGNLGKLTEALDGNKPQHYKLDRRFITEDDTGTYAVLVETKQNFVDADAGQLRSYVEEEYALHRGTKVIAILANTCNNDIRVWKSEVDDEHLLEQETVLDNITHYKMMFATDRQNDREAVMRNTYALNELLHRKDIEERNRSQFVGTCLLYIKDEVEKQCNGGRVSETTKRKLRSRWSQFSSRQIREGIGEVLENLLDGSHNKQIKVRLLKRDVLEEQHVKSLTTNDWLEVLSFILMRIYRFIDSNSSEGQDILNLFFITFNKYVGKADKNQAFTPDHITDFMTQLVGVKHKDVVLDECCGSGSFLVQAMVHELADARMGHTDAEFQHLADEIKQRHIYGIESEEKAYALSTTNMLIHGDGNSNVEFGSCFNKRDFIVRARPTVILMNPPYNSKPRSIPEAYKQDWSSKEKDSKSDPTKGMVFVKYLSDIAKDEGWNGVKLAVLLPMSAAIGTGTRLSKMKESLLKDNTLEAVLSLPAEIFYPGASVQACCMLFTLNQSHYCTGTRKPYKQTFFGYFRDDGFIKKKNLGRIEQFDPEGHSKWKQIENKWLQLFRNRTVSAGYSSMHGVTGDDEWLPEAYMKTDYSNLTEVCFRRVVNNHIAYLVKEGKLGEYCRNRKQFRRSKDYIQLGTYKPSDFLNNAHWGDFQVKSLFEVKYGINMELNACDETTLEDPNGIAFVSRTAEDNGVSAYVVPVEGKRPQPADTITVAGGGSVLSTFLQIRPFYSGRDLYLLLPKDKISKYSQLFVISALQAEKYRFNYGRQANRTLPYLNLHLPITDAGTPDWSGMDIFIQVLFYGD